LWIEKDHTMAILVGMGGLLLIGITLWDAFETIILPRRVRRPWRFMRLVYRLTWTPWSGIARRVRASNRRENLLSYYGPLSLLMLLGVWALCLIVGFAALHWMLSFQPAGASVAASFRTDLFLSGSSFFTPGLGSAAVSTGLTRLLMVMEGAVGFGFLAIIISYLPGLNGAFSQREVNVSLLDARAGSPPSAGELLSRCNEGLVDGFLRDWERWSAELMESHLSYPMLSYFRSQHDNQSWVTALTMVLDLCALVLAGIDGMPTGAAYLTFAMARHAAADLSEVLATPPRPPRPDRLPPADLARLRAELRAAGMCLAEGPAADQRLSELRQMYEPYVNGLAHHLLAPLPAWLPDAGRRDNWETTAWEA
jgi:hypothetical protein